MGDAMQTHRSEAPGGRESDRLAVVRELMRGRYDVRRVLAENRSFIGVQALDEGIERHVVLLAIDCERGAHHARAVESWLRELGALLDHPSFVAIVKRGIRFGVPYLELETTRGRTLGEQLAAFPLERRVALTLTLDVLTALAHAHAHGVSHGELTPEHVILGKGAYDAPVVKLLGTGLSELVWQLGSPPDRFHAPGRRYIAPEVLRGERCTARSDVYSAGALLYQMVTQEPPPFAPAVPAFSGHPNLPIDLEPILIRALAPDPFKRYGSVEEMASEIRDALTAGRALTSRPPRASREASPAAPMWRAAWVGAAVGAAALGALGIWIAGSASTPDVAPIAAEHGAPPASHDPHGANHDPHGSHDPHGASRVLAGAGAPSASATAATHVGDPRAAAVERAAERDPLASELPPALEEIRARVVAGERLTRDDFSPVLRYARAHEDDPRPHLLLGDAFALAGWHSDAIARYLTAYDVDPASRLHRPALDNLVAMAVRPSVSVDAIDTIVEIYGEDALPAIDAALADAAPRHEPVLRALRARVAARARAMAR